MTNETTNQKPTTATGQFRPRLSFFHPTGKGTGCALTMELHPAHDRTDGSIMMTVANQMTIGDRRAPNPTFPRFDWENAICVKLNFNDLCKFLQVLRGECESIEDGRGLYHRSPKGSTQISLRHMVEPVAGYSLELYRVPAAGGGETRTHLLLSPAEALGLCESIAGSMYLVSFGIPMLIARDTSAYVAATRSVRDAVPDVA